MRKPGDGRDESAPPPRKPAFLSGIAGGAELLKKKVDPAVSAGVPVAVPASPPAPDVSKPPVIELDGMGRPKMGMVLGGLGGLRKAASAVVAASADAPAPASPLLLPSGRPDMTAMLAARKSKEVASETPAPDARLVATLRRPAGGAGGSVPAAPAVATASGGSVSPVNAGAGTPPSKPREQTKEEKAVALAAKRERLLALSYEQLSSKIKDISIQLTREASIPSDVEKTSWQEKRKEVLGEILELLLEKERRPEYATEYNTYAKSSDFRTILNGYRGEFTVLEKELKPRTAARVVVAAVPVNTVVEDSMPWTEVSGGYKLNPAYEEYGRRVCAEKLSAVSTAVEGESREKAQADYDEVKRVYDSYIKLKGSKTTRDLKVPLWVNGTKLNLDIKQINPERYETLRAKAAKDYDEQLAREKAERDSKGAEAREKAKEAMLIDGWRTIAKKGDRTKLAAFLRQMVDDGVEIPSALMEGLGVSASSAAAVISSGGAGVPVLAAASAPAPAPAPAPGRPPLPFLTSLRKAEVDAPAAAASAPSAGIAARGAGTAAAAASVAPAGSALKAEMGRLIGGLDSVDALLKSSEQRAVNAILSSFDRFVKAGAEQKAAIKKELLEHSSEYLSVAAATLKDGDLKSQLQGLAKEARVRENIERGSARPRANAFGDADELELSLSSAPVLATAAAPAPLAAARSAIHGVRMPAPSSAEASIAAPTMSRAVSAAAPAVHTLEPRGRSSSTDSFYSAISGDDDIVAAPVLTARLPRAPVPPTAKPALADLIRERKSSSASSDPDGPVSSSAGSRSRSDSESSLSPEAKEALETVKKLTANLRSRLLPKNNSAAGPRKPVVRSRS